MTIPTMTDTPAEPPVKKPRTRKKAVPSTEPVEVTADAQPADPTPPPSAPQTEIPRPPIASRPRSAPRAENVHDNEATISGSVKKVVFQSGEVVLRLAQPLADGRENIVGVTIPGGRIEGTPVSLGQGDQVQVSGYLTDAPQRMPLSTILERMRLPDRAQPGDDKLVVGHITTRLIARSFERVAAGHPPLNVVRLGGVIHKFYPAKADTIVRLDIYDRHTQVVEHNDRVGLPHRQAHHVSLRLIGGQALDGHKPHLTARRQVVAVGALRQYLYSESLKKILMRARQFNRILDGDDERFITLEAFYVVVQSAIYPDVFINPLLGK